jgi:serine/threonine-protein kinase
MAATRRDNGDEVALKRSKVSNQARERIRREIKAQCELFHPNIMPIWDYDPGYRWYTMPRALKNLTEAAKDLDENTFASILINISDALAVAHDAGLIHRDISPNNILLLPSADSRNARWVVADWGLVRRPATSTSPPMTQVGEGLGTPGFNAPELMTDAKNATEAADVYSLGRIAEWFFSKDRRWLVSGVRILPEGEYQHWRFFVKSCTEPRTEDRPQSMIELREMLEKVFDGRDQPPDIQAASLLIDIMNGQGAELQSLANLASTFIDNAAIYLDTLAMVPSAHLRDWIPGAKSQAAQLAERMAWHTANSWGDRDLPYIDAPLAFVLTVLTTLCDNGDLGLAEDVALPYFLAECQANHGRQHARTLEWLADLSDAPSTVVARVITTRQELRDYYTQPAGWRPRSPLLAAALVE